MSDKTTNPPAHPFFGEVISSYTRAQALADAVLIRAGIIDLERGFTGPVALTAAAWADCVAWSNADSRSQVEQREADRLWVVLYCAACAVRLADRPVAQCIYELNRIPRDGFSTRAAPTQLKLVIGPGDAGEPVMTIMLPEED